jgi:hypothetical protein
MLVMRDFREVGLAVMGGHGGASRGPVSRRTPMCWKKAGIERYGGRSKKVFVWNMGAKFGLHLLSRGLQKTPFCN